MARWADLARDPLGTRHHRATCCWCGERLAIGELDSLRVWTCMVCWPRIEPHALYGKRGKKIQCLYLPLPSQIHLYESEARYILWGGQAGPGKSHGARHWLYERSLRVPGHEALLLRENWDQLETTHLRKMEREVPELGGRFWKSDRKASFGKGSDESIIDCGHMAETDAIGRYLSTEYNAIVPDEASLYPVDSEGVTPLAELSTRARKVGRDREGNLVSPRFIPVTNPGGPSAPWLKDMHIDHMPDLEKYPALRPVFDEETGEQIKGYRAEQWAYIPARLDDNPYQDPEYENSLAVLSAWRYAQLRKGDWSVFQGQFFSEFRSDLHVRALLSAA